MHNLHFKSSEHISSIWLINYACTRILQITTQNLMYTFILGEYHMIAVSESIARDVGKSGNTAVSSLVYLKGGGGTGFYFKL